METAASKSDGGAARLKILIGQPCTRVARPQQMSNVYSPNQQAHRLSTASGLSLEEMGCVPPAGHLSTCGPVPPPPSLSEVEAELSLRQREALLPEHGIFIRA